MSNFVKNIGILILYCLPALLACAMVGYSLYLRYADVTDAINIYAKSTLSESKAQIELEKGFAQNNEVFNRLITFLEREKATGRLAHIVAHNEFSTKLKEMFTSKCFMISALALLPYLLLGGRLSFGERKEADRRAKARIATEDLIMKFLVALIIANGWVYVLHPIGRGASIAKDLIDKMDIISSNSLPIYIQAQNMLAPTTCGFLGWYLNLLGYFFQKFIIGDVNSTRVYGVFFKKFLLVWGIALVVSSLLQGPEGKLIMFMIGFFPLSAFSLLKEAGVKTVKGDAAQKNSLTQLPAMSRWHSIRFEEEGIDNVPALAACDPAAVKAAMAMKPSIVDLWIDTARLFSLIGAEKYNRLKDFCFTATEFIKKSKDADFIKILSTNCQIENPDEITRVLQESYDLESPASGG